MNTNEIPNVALVGVGGYGNLHFRLLKELAEKKQIHFSAVVIRPQSMEKYRQTILDLQPLGTEIFPDLETLLQKKARTLDLIALPTGIEFHKSMTCLCLQAGVNVLLEKPAASSVADVNAMINAEKQSGKFVAVGFQHMYKKDIHDLKRLLLSGTCGRLKNISVMGLWPRNNSYYSRNSWAGKRQSANRTPILDSPANNALAHYWNIALFCAGNDFSTTAHPVSMRAEVVRARPEIEMFDTVSAAVKTDRDVHIFYSVSHACETAVEPKLRFELERGTILWDSNPDVSAWTLSDPDGTVVQTEKFDASRMEMFETVLKRLNHPEEFVYTLENAKEHTFCIQKMNELFPIHALKKDEIEVRSERDGQIVIPNINETMELAFRTKRTPSELGASWSPASQTILL